MHNEQINVSAEVCGLSHINWIFMSSQDTWLIWSQREDHVNIPPPCLHLIRLSQMDDYHVRQWCICLSHNVVFWVFIKNSWFIRGLFLFVSRGQDASGEMKCKNIIFLLIFTACTILWRIHLKVCKSLGSNVTNFHIKAYRRRLQAENVQRK